MFSSEFYKISKIIFFLEISKLTCVATILDKTVETKKKIYFLARNALSPSNRGCSQSFRLLTTNLGEIQH